MRTPAPAELLDAWDAGAVLPGAQRALLLLRAAVDGGGDLADLSIGERDRLLVDLRERLFGAILRAVADCRFCGVPLELVLPTAALLAVGSGPDVLTVRTGGYEVGCRVLRAGDLVDAAETGSSVAARALLVSRAVTSAERDGEPIAAAALPDTVLAEVAAALNDADPLANVELPVRCDACGGSWTSDFDIASYLWQELDAWARRLLGEVHTLARAYGWPEAHILALTPRRRRHYLELVADG